MKAIKLLSIPIFTGLFFGYHIGVIGPAIPLIQKQLSLSAWQAGHVVSLFIIGLIAGSHLSSFYLRLFSRKTSLVVLTICVVIQAFLGFVAYDLLTLLIYRLLSGLVMGIAATIGPTLSVENATISKRAEMTSYFQMSIALGVALSYFVGLLCLKKELVNLMFFSAGFLGLLGVVAYVNLPQLQQPWPIDGYQIKRYFKSYVVALGLNFFQQAFGINVITFFIQLLLSEHFAKPTMTSYLLPLVFNLVSIISTYFMTKKINSWGRKPFLLAGSLGMGFSMLLLACFYGNLWTDYFTLLTFTVFFASSFGPLVYLVTNEVLPNHVRAKGAGLSFFTNCLTNYFVSLLFLPIRNAFGVSFVWAFFAFIGILAFLFVLRRVPETAGQSTETIVKKLNHG